MVGVVGWRPAVAAGLVRNHESVVCGQSLVEGLETLTCALSAAGIACIPDLGVGFLVRAALGSQGVPVGDVVDALGVGVAHATPPSDSPTVAAPRCRPGDVDARDVRIFVPPPVDVVPPAPSAGVLRARTTRHGALASSYRLVWLEGASALHPPVVDPTPAVAVDWFATAVHSARGRPWLGFKVAVSSEPFVVLVAVPTGTVRVVAALHGATVERRTARHDGGLYGALPTTQDPATTPARRSMHRVPPRRGPPSRLHPAQSINPVVRQPLRTLGTRLLNPTLTYGNDSVWKNGLQLSGGQGARRPSGDNASWRDILHERPPTG